MFGFTMVRETELPFYREVHRLIEKNPQYLDGIREGTVHLKFRPKCAPVKQRSAVEKEEGRGENE